MEESNTNKFQWLDRIIGGVGRFCNECWGWRDLLVIYQPVLY